MPLVILSKETDTLGTDKYRDNDTNTPILFRPTVSHTVELKSEGTSATNTIISNVPYIVTVNGIATSQRSHRAVLKFFALQDITDPVGRAKAFDNLIAYCTKNKDAIINGSLPSTVTTFA